MPPMPAFSPEELDSDSTPFSSRHGSTARRSAARGATPTERGSNFLESVRKELERATELLEATAGSSFSEDNSSLDEVSPAGKLPEGHRRPLDQLSAERAYAADGHPFLGAAGARMSQASSFVSVDSNELRCEERSSSSSEAPDTDGSLLYEDAAASVTRRMGSESRNARFAEMRQHLDCYNNQLGGILAGHNSGTFDTHAESEHPEEINMSGDSGAFNEARQTGPGSVSEKSALDSTIELEDERFVEDLYEDAYRQAQCLRKSLGSLTFLSDQFYHPFKSFVQESAEQFDGLAKQWGVIHEEDRILRSAEADLEEKQRGVVSTEQHFSDRARQMLGRLGDQETIFKPLADLERQLQAKSADVDKQMAELRELHLLLSEKQWRLKHFDDDLELRKRLAERKEHDGVEQLETLEVKQRTVAEQKELYSKREKEVAKMKEDLEARERDLTEQEEAVKAEIAALTRREREAKRQEKELGLTSFYGAKSSGVRTTLEKGSGATASSYFTSTDTEPSQKSNRASHKQGVHTHSKADPLAHLHHYRQPQTTKTRPSQDNAPAQSSRAGVPQPVVGGRQVEALDVDDDSD